MVIELPAGSTVTSDAGLGMFHATGRLGDVRHRSGGRDVRIDEAADVSIKTAAGDITIGRAAGCDIATASGGVRLGTIVGAAVVKNSNGDTEIGDVTGDLRVRAANGKVSVNRAESTVAVKTANGDIRLGEVVRGGVVAETAYGRIDVGIRDGVAAWLDLNTAFGRVHCDLAAAERPAPGEDVVELKARTAFGDITIRRAAAIMRGCAVETGRPVHTDACQWKVNEIGTGCGGASVWFSAGWRPSWSECRSSAYGTKSRTQTSP